MIIIYTYDRKYIHVVKVSFCSQYSSVFKQKSFISQRIFKKYDVIKDLFQSLIFNYATLT